jgi:hypothetical protein
VYSSVSSNVGANYSAAPFRQVHEALHRRILAEKVGAGIDVTGIRGHSIKTTGDAKFPIGLIYDCLCYRGVTCAAFLAFFYHFFGGKRGENLIVETAATLMSTKLNSESARARERLETIAGRCNAYVTPKFFLHDLDTDDKTVRKIDEWLSNLSIGTTGRDDLIIKSLSLSPDSRALFMASCYAIANGLTIFHFNDDGTINARFIPMGQLAGRDSIRSGPNDLIVVGKNTNLRGDISLLWESADGEFHSQEIKDCGRVINPPQLGGF